MARYRVSDSEAEAAFLYCLQSCRCWCWRSARISAFVCFSRDWAQGCLWGGPPARSVRSIDLRARLVRVKRALTGGHGKSDLPCPRWLPRGPPRRRGSGHRRVAGRGRNGAYGMSGADPVGDNGKVGADGKDGRARSPIAQTVLWARMEAAGMGMWARTFRAV
jgi:hypothetical protein